jgi:hypothetical protein
MERIEQGATTMPIVLNEPEEIGAAMSPMACTTFARARTAAGLRSVSTARATSAARLLTRCVSIGSGPQEFEQADPVDDAGGAADADNQTLRSAHFLHITICKIQ